LSITDPSTTTTGGGKTYYRQLRIDPLPAESAVGLLSSLLGADASLEPLKRTLIERAEGNPLFLEEGVRTLVETNALVGVRGAYRLAQDLRIIEVPPTVQAILAARIDRLVPEDKRLLQAAAVIGEEVPLALFAGNRRGGS
jgi:predicted ATPase